LHLYDDKNRGRHSLLPISDGEQINVKTTCLDTYLKSQDIDSSAVTFIKIDIEGFEQVALKGASQTLSQRPMILSEFVTDYVKKGGLSVD
jgi:FkbM family methyltransferase